MDPQAGPTRAPSAESIHLHPRQWPAAGFLRALLRKPLGFAGLIVLLSLVCAAAFAPALAPYGQDESTNRYYASPSPSHPFGTDQLGRDIMSRVILGSRISLRVGLLAVAIGTLAGSAVGLISGYCGGWVDFSLQRVVDVMMALPGIILALAIMAALGSSIFNVTLAVAIALAPNSARVVRGSTLSVKERQFVEAARALGARSPRILVYHVLPNVAAPIIVIASIQLGVAIVAEASLSYLGLGVPLNVPSWGNMLSGAALTYMTKAPWMAVFPGLALTIAVLAINLFGDALRDILDPRLRGVRRV